ncbi:MAG: nicotinate-nucleotide adenylyltransferase [Lachnospiraceae bacterium]|nr:nicotinate-nucleotide adenylyltransferase [Lachnospiraceae bacterium]
MSVSRRRVGIMGGTFDPVHIGHLILGESARVQFSLEKVLFMPSGNPPHKKNRDGATNEERVEMVRLAIASNPHFELSLEEMHEEGYVYTKETLKRLRQRHPDTDYYFIMGADSVLTFDSWMGPQEICDQCILAAAVRDSLDVEQLDQAIGHLKEKYHADIRKLESPNLDISSHGIRSWVSEGRSIRYYVPDPVMNYILDKGIYGKL